jgi:hypothetical protein
MTNVYRCTNMSNDNKDKKRDIPPSQADTSSIETSDTEDVSKLVSSGTSSSKSGGGIDKDDIYSSDDSTRHLEKVQETEHND